MEVTFDLLTWNDLQAAPQLPSAANLKPSPILPGTGDWLIFTPDDVAFPLGSNPAGALSHNFADLAGAGGPGFNQAPSLSGNLIVEFTGSGPSSWHVAVTSQAYTGQASPLILMNQFLVTPGSTPTQSPVFNVDGLGNQGTWSSSSAGNWAFSTQLDFYFATNADGNPSPADVDATFNDQAQEGYLIPVDQLNPAGMASVNLDDSAGFYPGDFEQYLLDEIAPRLPADATYLLVTQMAKVNPQYAEAGLPLTSASLIGNITFAYTTQVIPEPASALLLVVGVTLLRRRVPGRGRQG
ncbi:MAG: hypothetical protein AMXMBFR13_35760 [Phycisphaerae bacterium]